MKNTILSLVILFIFIACSNNWEYKIVTVIGTEQSSYGNMRAKSFYIPDDDFNKLGKEGWELVDIFEIIETAHPNFGDERYVSGIQPNVRTAELNFVFKRKIR